MLMKSPLLTVLTVAAVMVATVAEIAASGSCGGTMFSFVSPVVLYLHPRVSLLMYRLVSGS